MERKLIIQDLLGSGGFSKVYKAILSVDGKSKYVAVKCARKTHKHGLVPVIEMFVLKKIDCRYLSKCIEVKFYKNSTYQSIQKLAVGDVYKYCRKSEKPLDLEIIKIWSKMILCGLCHLHSLGFAHADVKSRNCLVYNPNEEKLSESVIKLADYSLTIPIMDPDIGIKEPHGCVSYTSTHRPPEVWEKKFWTYSADIWAYACTIYEMGYGKNLFLDGNGVSSWSRAVRRLRSKKLSNKTLFTSHRDKEFSELRDLLFEMLSPDPNARPTCWELLKNPFFVDVKVTSDVHFDRRSFPIRKYSQFSSQILDNIIEKTGGKYSSRVCRILRKKLIQRDVYGCNMSSKEKIEEINIIREMDFDLYPL